MKFSLSPELIVPNEAEKYNENAHEDNSYIESLKHGDIHLMLSVSLRNCGGSCVFHITLSKLE